MAKEKEISQRDLALINILERLADQIQLYDAHLDEIAKHQMDLSDALDRNEQQKIARQDMTGAGLEDLKREFLRYRSDMLSIVREQDHLDERMKSLSKRQDMIAGAQEDIGRDLANLVERFKIQEKTARDHYEFALKYSDSLSGKIADLDRHVAKLHMDTEKHVLESNKDYRQQIESLRQDIMKRLLALDGIESALQVLMVRTEPPEKKPFILVRLCRWIAGFFRRTSAKMFKKKHEDEDFDE